MEDLTQLSDQQIEDRRVAIMDELARRNQLRDIPEQVRQMAQSFEALGGNKEDLVSKVNEPTPTPEPVEEPQPEGQDEEPAAEDGPTADEPQND